MLPPLPLFGVLTATELSTLELFSQRRTLQAWEILFHEGDAASSLYIVLSGSLQAYQARSSGEKILGSIATGEIVGEMALFDPESRPARTASIRALESTELLVLLGSAFETMMRQHGELFAKIREIIAQRKQRNTAQ